MMKDAPTHFHHPKSLEISGRKRLNVWKIFAHSVVPKDGNVLSGSFLALNDNGDVDEKAKPRYIMQVGRYIDKPFMVQGTATLPMSSVRTVLSVAAVKIFRVSPHDRNKIYFQRRENLSRKMYIFPKMEGIGIIGISEDDIMKLLRPL